jgi:uncharacterized membrane protein|tara:strand:+ start:5180 stop:5404 length:225 start_codon:yes stop_codon:yes gene_type:complete
MYPERKRSNWWYLVPILFGIIGGIIGYFALKRDAPEKAKKCLYLGLVLTVINIIANIALFSVGIGLDQGYNVNA